MLAELISIFLLDTGGSRLRHQGVNTCLKKVCVQTFKYIVTITNAYFIL